MRSRLRTPRAAAARALAAPLVALLVASLSAAVAADADDEILYELTAEEYYSMPELFVLDDLERCEARGGSYCLGSFELYGEGRGGQRLLHTIQRYSANWVDNFNHSRLHRGLCLSSSCPPAPRHSSSLHDWFSWCVNASMQSGYNLSAAPLHLWYCRPAPLDAPLDAPLSAAERAFAAAAAALLAIAAISTVLDLTLSDQAKKAWSWSLSWSVPGSWRELQAQSRGGSGSGSGSVAGGGCAAGTDLRSLDGLRVLCMMCVIIEHVCWLATQHYIANTREYEMMRRSWEAMLMVNSTLVVQIFFLMSSFLLAHKLLQRPVGPSPGPSLREDRRLFASTMLNRIVRVSPSYWAMVWFAAYGWQRMGAGPLWAPLVGSEAAVCRRKWWAHLLYLNNVIYPDDKCLIQTWYLAADMQLYVASLLLSLWLRRVPPRRALPLLGSLLAGSLAALAAIAYAWRLVPTFAMHNPELVRQQYSGEASFNVLYQSPLGNSPGALAGLLLAFTHHALRQTKLQLNTYRWFRWGCAWAPWLAVCWAGLSPALLPLPTVPTVPTVPTLPTARARLPSAALAALERPVFAAFVSAGLLGAMHGVKSPLRSVLSWRGWTVPARLSFAVLLLHMPLNKGLVAARTTASVLNRKTVVVEWFGVAVWSYALAVPLAVLVELPAQRLYRALTSNSAASGNPATKSAASGNTAANGVASAPPRARGDVTPHAHKQAPCPDQTHTNHHITNTPY